MSSSPLTCPLADSASHGHLQCRIRKNIEGCIGFWKHCEFGADSLALAVFGNGMATKLYARPLCSMVSSLTNLAIKLNGIKISEK